MNLEGRGGKTMLEILNEVAARHKIHPRDLQGRSRKRPFPTARQEAYYLMRERRGADGTFRYSLTQIGRFFGHSDHTTVVHGIKKHKGRMVEP